VSNSDISKSLFVKCACSSHLLEVEKYKYTWKDGGLDEGFNVVCWHYGHDGNIRGWREKFRWCWHILKTGKPWADSIIATNEDARGIAEFILKNLPNEEKNENDKNKAE
jgi:hypothetical protein